MDARDVFKKEAVGRRFFHFCCEPNDYLAASVDLR